MKLGGSMVTLSMIKADIGSVAGHVTVHDEVLGEVEEYVAEKGDFLRDYYVFNCGDDLQILMVHELGENNPRVHGLAWEALKHGAEIAKELKLYGAGQDLLSDAFSGNVRGLGPGVAEMSFTERKSEPFVVFAIDKTEASAFNLPLFRIFADPFNTAGLVISPKLHKGFIFEVHDVKNGLKIELSTPEEMYDLLALIGLPERYVIKRVYTKDREIAAVASTERLNVIAGRYVGKDDPCAIVRAQSQFPAVGEILEPFALAHLVFGWMRGSHVGPLMPVSLRDARPTRFDGPPRIVALGFQLSNSELIGPIDLFDDPAFEHVRRKAMEIADYLRAHGPFQPHLLPESEMEYTTLPEVLKKLEGRFERLE